jgi:selenocysteine-specific translation elongation factor
MTGSLTVAVVGSNGVAKELGKKGTASDLTLFNDVHEELALTLVEPTQFPEKLATLFNALAMADHCLLLVPELSRPIGEALAVVDMTELPTTVARGPAVGEAELARALKGTRLENAPRAALDTPSLRASLAGLSARPRDGTVQVAIDHAFPVKGVGAVALGVVRQGVVHAHDRLRLWPTPKMVEVRSLQVHDIDRKDAGVGERVGVALKSVEADEISRGQLLAPEGSLREGTALAAGAFHRCRYYRGDAGPGAQLHVSVGLQVVPASVDELGPGGARVTTDRPVVWAPGVVAYLLDLSVPAGPRFVGTMPLTG